MSYLRSAWLRPAAGLLVVIAITTLWLMGVSTTEAGNPGQVTIVPANAQVGVGGTTTVSVNVGAPDGGGLSVWIIRIGYDPAVVQVNEVGGNPDCQAINVPDPGGPGNVVQANGCAATDTPPTGSADDTAVVFGAWVKNVDGTATGWSGTNTVANITFRAVGTAGQQSALTVVVEAGDFLRPSGDDTNPTVTNGNIEIIAGTPQIWGNSDCSADGVRSRDGQAIGKFVLEGTPLSQTEPPPCPDVGATVTVDGEQRTWGNWDCSADGVRSRDGQAIGKFVLEGTPLSQTDPCPEVGATVTVS